MLDIKFSVNRFFGFFFFFPFSALNISSHSLLAFKVSVKKPTNLIWDPLHVMSSFSLTAVKILLVFVFFTFCLGESLDLSYLVFF